MRFGDNVFSTLFESSQRILIGGGGGGYDVFCALPLYFALKEAGKTVVLANSSFSALSAVQGERLHPACLRVTARTSHSLDYFPEFHLCRWLEEQGNADAAVYAFEQTGVAPLRAAYAAVAQAESIDTVVLVDGGVDMLLRGDESGLGTPAEDIASLAAVAGLPVGRKFVVCTAFGVDAYHGVAHADFLAAAGTLMRRRAFHGLLSLLPTMEAAEQFRSAVEFAHAAHPAQPSVVCLSMLKALQGASGYTEVREGASVWLSPLMSAYWFFDLQAVFERHLFAAALARTTSFADVVEAIQEARRKMPIEPRMEIPV
ncbi:MAG TPA: DUF1152 domain-containing protein [Opitutaceae bacterium]